MQITKPTEETWYVIDFLEAIMRMVIISNNQIVGNTNALRGGAIANITSVTAYYY